MNNAKGTFAPSWENVEKWTNSFIRKNVWRVKPAMDEDDCRQECYIKFIMCCDRYLGSDSIVSNAAHFFSLYRTAVHNMLHNRAKQNHCRALPSITAPGDEGDEFSTDDLLARHGVFTTCDAEFLAKLAELPEQCLTLLVAMQDPELAAALDEPNPELAFQRKDKMRKRETTNTRWCRILGYDPKTTDIVGPLRELTNW